MWFVKNIDYFYTQYDSIITVYNIYKGNDIVKKAKNIFQCNEMIHNSNVNWWDWNCLKNGKTIFCALLHHIYVQCSMGNTNDIHEKSRHRNSKWNKKNITKRA